MCDICQLNATQTVTINAGISFHFTTQLSFAIEQERYLGPVHMDKTLQMLNMLILFEYDLT